MGSKTIKTALVIAAVATGFAAIPAIGASGDNIGVGTVFTSTNTASISSIKDGKVSFVTDRVDVTSSTYDYSLDIVTAKIHEITSDDNNTYIHLVDYDGDFEHKFQKKNDFFEIMIKRDQCIESLRIECF